MGENQEKTGAGKLRREENVSGRRVIQSAMSEAADRSSRVRSERCPLRT